MINKNRAVKLTLAVGLGLVLLVTVWLVSTYINDTNTNESPQTANTSQDESTSQSSDANAYLKVLSEEVRVGEPVLVELYINSQDTRVNATKINVSYQQELLELVNVDYETSAFTLEAGSLTSSGLITTDRAHIEGLAGENKVATFTFNPKAAGSTEVSVVSDSVLLSVENNENVLTDFGVLNMEIKSNE